MVNYKRYQKNPVEYFTTREWTKKEIENAPIWWSVDLRDGKQALMDPMVVSEKREMIELLVNMGFKEIEIGFPSASQIEFDYLRQLVDRKLIPDDVKVQVLTQCREELIDRTFESIEGCKEAIVHIYNSTSTLQRDVVFGMSQAEIKEIAISGTKMVKERAKNFAGKVILEYSPESFTGTELDYSLEVCEAVLDTWEATKENPVIINLPSTVEMTTPNVFADRIEWFIKNLKDRDRVILSIHPHNDRGTGVATAELALLAGADRVEGTLFGNGERTGNVDILNIAYNMFSQGINPELEIEHVNDIIEIYERCCKIPVHPRHPYAGKLVFTAFSGSHQDGRNSAHIIPHHHIHRRHNLQSWILKEKAMRDLLMTSIKQIGVFMICAQALIHFKPNGSYEKYIKLLVSVMILVQVFIPITKIFSFGWSTSLDERISWYEEQMTAGIELSNVTSREIDSVLTNMTLEEVRYRYENLDVDDAEVDLEMEQDEDIVIEIPLDEVNDMEIHIDIEKIEIN